MGLFVSKQGIGIADKTLFGKVWEQTEVTVRLVISYFNWVWQHSCLGTVAAQRSELADYPWTWNDIATYPALL